MINEIDTNRLIDNRYTELARSDIDFLLDLQNSDCFSEKEEAILARIIRQLRIHSLSAP
jgi:hypothetical protein